MLTLGMHREFRRSARISFPSTFIGIAVNSLRFDLRLLDLTEKQCGGADALLNQIVTPRDALNLSRKRVHAPVQEIRHSI